MTTFFKIPVKGELLRKLAAALDYEVVNEDNEERHTELITQLEGIETLLKKIEIHLASITDLEINDYDT